MPARDRAHNYPHPTELANSRRFHGSMTDHAVAGLSALASSRDYRVLV